MGHISTFLKAITGNFFAGYILGFTTMILVPRKLFQKIAIGYYEYQELDDIPLEPEGPYKK